MKIYLALLTSLLFCTQLWAQPLNDDCLGAITIPTTNDFCSAPMEFSNVGATLDVINPPSAGQMAVTQCVSTDFSNGIWFILFPEQPGILITINCAAQTGTCVLPEAVLFTGSCTSPDGFIFENCSPSNNSSVLEFTTTGLTIGQRYYLFVASETTGSMQVCVDNFIPVPSPQSDCSEGVILCNTDPFQVDALNTAGNNTNELDDFQDSCIPTELNSVWYRWVCKDSGTLSFTLTPNNSPIGEPSDDLDFAVFQLPGGINDCANKEMLRCMASGGCNEPFEVWQICNGPTGLALTSTDFVEEAGCSTCQGTPGDDDNFVSFINMIQGEAYAVLIQNFSPTGQGFSIEFGGTGTFEGPEAFFEPMAVGDTLACEKEVIFTDLSTFSSADPIANYNWNFGAGAMPQTAMGPGPHSVEYASFGEKSAILTVESEAGCLVSEIVTVRVGACCEDFNQPILSVAVGDFVCPGEDSGSLSFSVEDGTPEFNFNIPGVSPPDIFTPNPSVGGLPAGTFTVLVQDARGCLDTIVETIPEPDPLTIDAGLDIEVDLGLLDTLNATVDSPSTDLTYMWDPEEGLNCPDSDFVDCPNPIVFAPGTTTYSVTVTDERGCTSFDQVTVTTNIIRPIFCPNIIAAGSGDNSLWRLGFGPQAELVEEIFIFDRWGNEIYKDLNVAINADNEMEGGWDGRFGGDTGGGGTQFVNPGVFAWLAKVRFIDNVSVVFSGDITVVR